MTRLADIDPGLEPTRSEPWPAECPRCGGPPHSPCPDIAPTPRRTETKEAPVATTIGQPALDGEKPADDDDRMWSVTTIIGALDKPALLYWAAEQTAICAVDQLATVQAMISDGDRDDVIKWLRDARFRRPKGQRTAADLGTAVHEACEQFALTGTRPEVDDDVAPFLDRFDEWCQKFQPIYEAAEVTVYSPRYGYAGTCDAFLSVDGVRFIVDYKTSKKSTDGKGKITGPYPEVALQLAAYRHAEMAAVWRPRRMDQFRRRYYLLGQAEKEMAVPVPEVDTGLVIHITPDHCDAYPVDCGPDIHRAFLFVLEAARWQFQTSKSVIGMPLQAPAKETAA